MKQERHAALAHLPQQVEEEIAHSLEKFSGSVTGTAMRVYGNVNIKIPVVRA